MTPSHDRERDEVAPVRSADTTPLGRSVGVGQAIPLTRREAMAASSEDIGSGVRNDGVDWKMMLRLGTNWFVISKDVSCCYGSQARAYHGRARGNASSHSTITLPPSPSPSAASLDLLGIQPHPPNFSSLPASSQHVALSPSFIFTSDPSSPLVHVYTASRGSSARLGIIPPPPGWSSPARPDNVTAIAADQAVALHGDEPDELPVGDALPARLAVFYQSGGIVILSILIDNRGGVSRLDWGRECVNPPLTRPSRRRRGAAYAPQEGDPVVLAVLHHPVLVTCSADFHLSVYSLLRPISSRATEVDSSVSPLPLPLDRISTFHSDISFHPAALSLFPTTDISHGHTKPSSAEHLTSHSFRVSLTYSTPVYPASWTVAAQEFVVALNPRMGTRDVARTECYNVGCGNLGDDSDEESVWPRRIKPVIGVKGRRATGIGTDGRWCVLSGSDNQIQVYALPASKHSASLAFPMGLAAEIKSNSLPDRRGRKRFRSGSEGDGNITHSQTLLAHSAEVTALALSGGRCISGGSDGRVLVWNLDEEVESEHRADAGVGEGRVGRTVGYVEVRTGEERVWRGAAGPRASGQTDHSDPVIVGSSEQEVDDAIKLPHPQAISGAARSFFLPRPPMPSSPASRTPRRNEQKLAIRHLAFDEEKIVGLIRTAHEPGRSADVRGDIMRVWNFNG